MPPLHPQVLIVEDDVAISTLVQKLLARHGYVCDVIGDGDTAIRRLRTQSYDAVLLDLMLPGCFGFDVLRFLKAERPAMAQKVVVMTAASAATLRDFDVSAVRAVLRKPFDIDVLVAYVSACVGHGDVIQGPLARA
ncbi:MAG: response regulator transcription factor [Thermoanaerobaculia bacterium]